jgi:hypothetical protein
VYIAYNIPLSTHIANMFDNWLNKINKKSNARIYIDIFMLVCLDMQKPRCYQLESMALDATVC